MALSSDSVSNKEKLVFELNSMRKKYQRMVNLLSMEDEKDLIKRLIENTKKKYNEGGYGKK